MRSDPTLFEEYAHQCKQRSQSAHDPHVRTSLQISRTNGAIWLIWHERWRRRSAPEWVSMRGYTIRIVPPLFSRLTVYRVDEPQC
jgi:hypothetical protein